MGFQRLIPRGVLVVVSIAALMAALTASRGGVAEPATQDSASTDDQNFPEWKYYPGDPGLMESMEKYGDGVRVEFGPGSPQVVTIQVKLREPISYSWKGSEHSVFVAGRERLQPLTSGKTRSVLYYADFKPDQPGGSIVAVAWETGKELWRSKLNAVPGNHAGAICSNHITLVDGYGDDFITTWGVETDGRYVEVKEKSTGKTTSHHVFKDPK